jgi:CRISPR-associated protein Csx14
MTAASIPVDLFNPGQVFAALGFLEAASALCSRAAGRFDWSDEANVCFVLDADSQRNPFEVVLEFLAKAEVRRIAPLGYKDPPPKKKKTRKVAEGDEKEEEAQSDHLENSGCFPGRTPDCMALPVRLTDAKHSLDLTHWADGSSRNDFKLYAGNRSAAMIARAMLIGTREKPRKGRKVGDLKTKGIRALWEKDPKRLAEQPFDVLTPIGGSFNFDPRGAWKALDAGYSPNDQKHAVDASPVLELLAAVGLEHARPLEDRETGLVRYAVWGELVPALLARPLLAGVAFGVPVRKFAFTLDSSGKNKIVTFAEEELSS